MALRRPILNDLSAGELSPKMYGKYDQEVFSHGARSLKNYVPFLAGGARSRPPTKDLGLTKSGGAARLIPFNIGGQDFFVLELTALLIRIWKSDALVGAPTEKVTTYTADELFEIQYEQVANILHLVHYNHAIATLTWDGGTSFTLADLTITMGTDIPAWATATAYNTGDVVIAGALPRVYTCITAGTSHAATAPTAETNDVTDGTVHWWWEYTKPFSQASDYPATIGFFDGSMYYGGSLNEPSMWTRSYVNDFGCMDMMNIIQYTTLQPVAAADWANPIIPENELITRISPVITEANAYQAWIYSKKDETIVWMCGADAMVIGCNMSEWVVAPQDSAANLSVHRRSGFGSAYIQPELFGDAIVFAHGYLDSARIIEYEYLAQSAVLSSHDLGIFADHMLDAGITQMDFAQYPEPTLYCVTDGELACLLRKKQFGIAAWYHITTDGGDIESVAVSAGDSGYDQVHVIVNRADGRHVERLLSLWGTDTRLDCYVDVPSIAGATETGLDQFTGETVTIYNVTDDTTHTAAVSDGTLTYPSGDGVGDHVIIGMAIDYELATLPPVFQTENGPVIGLEVRPVAVKLRVMDSWPFDASYSSSGSTEEATRVDGVAWTAAFSGLVEVPVLGDWSEDAGIWITQSEPKVVTILAIVPELEA